MTPEKEKQLNGAYQAFMELMLKDFPVERLPEFVHDQVMGYGTTLTEKMFDKEALADLIKAQRAQSKGLEMHGDIHPVKHWYSQNEELAIFVDEITIRINPEGQVMELNVRLSLVFEYLDGTWKLVHLHGSKPEYDDSGQDTWHLNEWKNKNEELQQLVDEKTADLENKNRELEIGASLERVRTAAMAMKTPDDMVEVCRIISGQLQSLGFTDIRNVQTAIIDEEKKIYHNYQYFTAYDKGVIEKTDYTSHPTVQEMIRSIKRSEDAFFTGEFKGRELEKFREWRKQAGQFPDPLLDEVESMQYYFYSIGEGALGLATYKPLSTQWHEIYKRFHTVFKLAYRRFIDIQIAEAQAREAQVELALERIRAQATAMKESSDLLDIVVTMNAEFNALGHEAHYFWHMRWLTDTYEKAMTSGDGSRIGMVMELPRGFHENAAMLAWEKSTEPVAVFTFDIEGAADYIDKMSRLGRFSEIDHNAPGPEDLRAMGGLTFVMARTTHGEIGYSLPGIHAHPPEEDLDTLARFAGVFDLAYRRFEDLKDAERRNRETQIELALERVRAKAMAMQEPEELKQVADVLRHEMGQLGVEELETSSIYILGEKPEEAECWYALKDADAARSDLINDHFKLNLDDTWVGREMLKFYRSGEVSTSIVMTGKHRVEWIRYCEERSAPLRGYYGDVIPDRTYHLFKFSHGSIGAATPGDISTESWGLLQRAASVFSLAYSRFKDLSQARSDLQKLKAEKKRAEDALKELRAAQTQLVHAEKMASLGELTAGIAHEIQNPLNFINNFSELNRELIEELVENLANGDTEEATVIAKDIAGNEEKIKHHGLRADSIVKGMLQHSRSSNGHKEPTDINTLADEYLRLAYHGLRAKDKNFQSDFRLAVDKTIPKINVVPQDIGRVMLNLINNAFYAVYDKASTKAESGYKPEVVLSTKKVENKIEITVQDNGNGIPETVREKIFQPFFTTKPSGHGTGLGLSLSFDIITKGHGGELKMETKEGEGTTFRISLPQNINK